MTTYLLRNVESPEAELGSSVGLRRVVSGIAVEGPQGPPGTAGGGFVHTQATPATPWIVNHNLGYRPAVEVYDSGGNEVIVEVAHISLNQYEVRPQPAMSGFTRAV